MGPAGNGNGSGSGYEVCVVGGAGHVGVPLSIVMAHHGIRTLIYDINAAALERLRSGVMPFFEEGGEPLLKEVLAEGTLGFSTDIADLAKIPTIIVTIGTPIDEFHNPQLRVVTDCIDAMLPYLSDEQTIILRSTVFPGVTDYVHWYIRSHGKRTKVAFCPERVVQGFSVKEIQTLPQIVSGVTRAAEKSAAELFARIAPSVVRMVPKEAEFAKLMSNAYRYIQFAAANQFYMLAEAAGVDYHRMVSGLKHDYPRLRDLPGPGFAAGPCLFKDTLQLAAFANSQFGLGYSAMHVNEGLPAFVVSRLRARFGNLNVVTVGLLGMAFKADSDDARTSLSYRLKKILQFQAKRVLTTDPYVRGDADLIPLERVVEESDVLILCAPHSAYRAANLRGKPVVDVWNFYKGETGLADAGVEATASHEVASTDVSGVWGSFKSEPASLSDAPSPLHFDVAGS